MLMDYYSWVYPQIPEDVNRQLLKLGDSLVVVGVLGRSRNRHANKMQAFGMKPSSSNYQPIEGQMLCYFKPGTSTLFLHFETPWDEVILSKLLLDEKEPEEFDFDQFYETTRNRCIRQMTLALHVCHILIYVETSQIFDMKLVTIFQLLKQVREQQIMQFVPQLLTELPLVGRGGKCRLCTPRILFLFENYPHDEEKTKETISAYEFQTEDSIYQLLRHHNIVTNSSSSSLLALPNNKQFVFYNAYENLHPDRLLQAIDSLNQAIQKTDLKEDEEDLEILELSPFEGFVKPFGEFPVSRAITLSPQDEEDQYKKDHTAWHFLQRHVQDALKNCFDEGSFKQGSPQGQQFQKLNINDWHKWMDNLYKILVANVANSNYETNNEEYRAYLRNFDQSLNYERKFWLHLCELGLKKGISCYKHSVPAFYGLETHEKLLAEAILAFEEDGRGPPSEAARAKLSGICLKYWQDGRQQCEQLSLRRNPCTQAKEAPHEKHSSGIIHVSSCNCGRTQGRREDPFTLRQANYEFYEYMAKICNLCVKVKQYQFPIFEPSVSDYRAAAFEAAFPLLHGGKPNADEGEQAAGACEEDEQLTNGCSQPLSATFGSDLNMSIGEFDALLEDSQEEEPEISYGSADEDDDESLSNTNESLSENTENELILQFKGPQKAETNDHELDETETIVQNSGSFSNSTTEYLPGLVHTFSNPSLLPMFPSWSLACVGPSSIYSHNTGLQEHFQSGFLSGANFLLPWDVHVRLVQEQKNQHHLQQMGKKHLQRYRKSHLSGGDRLTLKIFVGFEYECSRGHRFMMCSPERVLRGGADIERDTSHKVVHQNMPLYYPCPCRSQSNYLAQLMRIHVVTPKAPVNIILDPRVCVDQYTFTLGTIAPPRLSQSAYWMLRLPYVYQGDDHLLSPPQKLEADDTLSGGYLLAGMFGVAETEANATSAPSLDTPATTNFMRI
ncbi:nonsense-mediated mRNA decay factor SMG8 [Drosophila tropicalis]|uniref:nonsense-mediated mRNA decay factor SMG8 n=1 Tax=Drosophila tropicalis TaxID=46794 RepID=UPI0035AB9181